ncbi:hypothetical protein [Mangrovibacter sp. MFB070]|uniref:hypothetical protein n=1 Tax=Mangrovibacter sp. MFB070 TaxID=1224318 RepID=UPI0013646F77|nr:hypothetical protein [Mangrovibacter sp. MFB070]
MFFPAIPGKYSTDKFPDTVMDDEAEALAMKIRELRLTLWSEESTQPVEDLHGFYDD